MEVEVAEAASGSIANRATLCYAAHCLDDPLDSTRREQDDAKARLARLHTEHRSPFSVHRDATAIDASAGADWC